MGTNEEMMERRKLEFQERRRREAKLVKEKRTAAIALRNQKKKERSLRNARTVHTATFLTALFAFGILSLALAKPTYSEAEKRDLATMPEFSAAALTQGSYTKDLEFFYADTFPFREEFVTFAARLDEWRGIRFDGVRIHGAPSPLPIETRPEETVPPIGPEQSAAPSRPVEEATDPSGPKEITDTPPAVADDGATGEQVGAVFVYKDKAMSIFGASQSLGEWYAKTISAYQEAWGSKVQVYNVVIPTSIEFALPDRYRDVSMPQGPNIKHIYESLDNRVIPVDAYGEIAAHTDEYLYFSSDHHWTGLGAYYAYRAFAESAGLTPMELSGYEKRTITGFRGTMFAQTNDAALAEDYVDYYIVPVEVEAVRYDQGAPDIPVPHSIWADYATGINSYSVYLHGDFPLIHAKTSVKNGRKALVVKESFGNAFAPYLLAHYEELYIVDQRYFLPNLVEYVEKNGIQDVIFINNAFAAHTPYHIEKIAGMMTDRRYVATQPPPQPQTQPPADPAEQARQDGAEGQDAAEPEQREERRTPPPEDNDE